MARNFDNLDNNLVLLNFLMNLIRSGNYTDIFSIVEYLKSSIVAITNSRSRLMLREDFHISGNSEAERLLT